MEQNHEFDSSEIIRRVQKVMHDREMNQAEFASSIGLQQNTYNQQLKKKRASLGTVYGTLMRFPDISPDWLLFGRGDMKRAAGTSISIQRQGNVNNVGGAVTQSMDGGRAQPTAPPCHDCNLVNRLTELLQLALSRGPAAPRPSI